MKFTVDLLTCVDIGIGHIWIWCGYILICDVPLCTYFLRCGDMLKCGDPLCTDCNVHTPCVVIDYF